MATQHTDGRVVSENPMTLASLSGPGGIPNTPPRLSPVEAAELRKPIEDRLIAHPRVVEAWEKVFPLNAARAHVIDELQDHLFPHQAARDWDYMVSNPSVAEGQPGHKAILDAACQMRARIDPDSDTARMARLSAIGMIRPTWAPFVVALRNLLDAADVVLLDMLSEAEVAEEALFDVFGLERVPTAVTHRVQAVQKHVKGFREVLQPDGGNQQLAIISKSSACQIISYFAASPEFEANMTALAESELKLKLESENKARKAKAVIAQSVVQ